MNKTLLPAVVLLVVLFAGVADADVVRLRTGEVIKGRPIREKSDEHVLVIDDILNGTRRAVSWEAVEPADRERLQRAWDLANPMLAPVPGQRVTMNMEGGGTMDVFGRIVSREGGITLLRRGKKLKIPKERIVGVTSEVLDPRAIWSPEQLVARFRLEMALAPHEFKPRDHFRLAENARIVGAFEVARKHYEACAHAEGFLSAPIARERLVEIELLLSERQELRDLRAVRAAIAQRSFRRARKLLEAFDAKHTDTEAEVQKQREEVAALFKIRRDAHFRREARYRFPKLARRQIDVKVREKDIGVTDVVAWTRRELPDSAFAALASFFGRWDDVTPEEARLFWDERRRSSWRTAGYGSGTFIVERPKVDPPKRKGGTGRAPKPLTRDAWWHHASPGVRAEWTMAFFVERAGLFEIADPRTRPLCPTCAGKGLHRGSICPRCAGTQADKRLRFR